LIKINDRVSFTKNGIKITGKIVDYFYHDNKDIGVIVEGDDGELHAVKESDLE
jgi:hypothetical protein